MEEKRIHWGHYTSEDLRKTINSNTVVALAVGSHEQHGFHLPLETDTKIGYRIIEEAAKAAQEQVLILPPVWIGYSPHHMDFCGSITLSQETLCNMVIDICKSLAHHGVQKILVLNSHGGNTGILRVAVDEMGAHHGIYPVLVTYYHFLGQHVKDIQKSAKGGMGHACELETSLQMVLTPDLVKSDHIEGGIIQGNKYLQPGMFISNRIYQYRSFSHYSRFGVIGDPHVASKETGEKAFKLLVEEIRNLLDDMAKGLV